MHQFPHTVLLLGGEGGGDVFSCIVVAYIIKSFIITTMIDRTGRFVFCFCFSSGTKWAGQCSWC